MVEQYDIVENRDRESRGAYPYLIILQHNRAETVRTIVAAPLAPFSSALSASRMHPSINVRGERYLALVEQLAAVQRRTLGHAIGSAKAHQYEITAALDMLFTGI